MDDYFSKDIGKRHVYVLHGLGGSGKTQIALKFLDITNQHPTPRSLSMLGLCKLWTSFKNIAIANKIGNSLQDALLWLITSTEEWMLLFDNADDPNINLFPFFPQCTHGNIIITSRNPRLAELCYLPLAIIQAGAYISKFNCLDQYLSLYKENHVRLLKQHPEQSHDDYEWTVYTTWEN
ncbi:hypothetical protein B0H14DRAFT_2920693 [Mycena olivaceomarginata]|nr:hypothetical protein B0H14DRAFT_2920693 [Mycena olivaceomarginata]